MFFYLISRNNDKSFIIQKVENAVKVIDDVLPPRFLKFFDGLFQNIFRVNRIP